MVNIDKILVDEAVASSTFCCDLKACRGICCCLEGGRGAPLADEEVPLIAAAFPHAKEYLTARSLEVIAREGLVEGWSGNYATVCIDNRECVFVYFEDGIAKCAFERAFNEGKTSWQKPISCHLYPIRVRHEDGTFLRYEQMHECQPARDLGQKSNVPLVDFLKQPLIRAFGEEWYLQLRNVRRETP